MLHSCQESKEPPKKKAANSMKLSEDKDNENSDFQEQGTQKGRPKTAGKKAADKKPTEKVSVMANSGLQRLTAPDYALNCPCRKFLQKKPAAKPKKSGKAMEEESENGCQEKEASAKQKAAASKNKAAAKKAANKNKANAAAEPTMGIEKKADPDPFAFA